MYVHSEQNLAVEDDRISHGQITYNENIFKMGIYLFYKVKQAIL